MCYNCKDCISIVIPNYNGRHYLENILPALMSSRHEIIIIDNASNDGSKEYLEQFDGIKMIINNKNNGFSGAVNQGIKASKNELVLLLNNDTFFNTSDFDHLIRVMQSEDNVFSVSSKMIQHHNRNLIDTAGDEYNVLGWAFKRGYNKSVVTRTTNCRVFSSCAGAALYRKKIFDEIGFFDENFFAYMEDVDIGYRANIYGYKNVYCADTVVYHIGSGTSGSGRNAFKSRLSGRNNIYVVYKNMPFIQIILNFPVLTIGFLIKWYFFTRHGLGSDYIQGVKSGLRTLKTIKKVPFRGLNWRHYLWIQLRMIWNVPMFVMNRFK